MLVTLTDIMPTLRMSIPDPIDLLAWPPSTTVTTNDVLVENLSMLRVADLLGTPCAWNAETPSSVGCRTVTMCSVSAVVRDGDEPIALVDCDVARIGANWAHARLIGRISVAYKGFYRLLGDGSHPRGTTLGATSPDRQSGAQVSLPKDLAVGDLLVVPCLPVQESATTVHGAATPPRAAART